MTEYIVSACLAGVACRYNASHALCPYVYDLVQKGHALPVCPEILGGLPTPRAPVEIMKNDMGNAICTASGDDYTEAFQRGAAEALKIALNAGCKKAIIKTRSPSCGRDDVYDGSFSGTLVPGTGLWAHLLREHGFALYTEEDLPK